MASSLIAKRFLFLSSSLLSRSLLRPAASASASRSFNTNDHDDDRRDDVRSVDVLDPSTLSSSQVLNMMNQFTSASPGNGPGASFRRGWDARETKDALFVRVDMPGLGKEDVKIYVEHNTLTAKGEAAKEGHEKESAPRLHYTCRIHLLENVYRIDQVKAEMKNGVLNVLVPKIKDEERKDVISVKVE